MQAKKRYVLVLLSIAFLVLCYFGGHRLKKVKVHKDWRVLELDNYFHVSDIMDEEYFKSASNYKISQSVTRNDGMKLNHGNCRMETCFNFSMCDSTLKVYVYPVIQNLQISPLYQKILKVLKESNYYTADPSQACVFILSLDTLDRDSLSVDYVRNLPSKISKLSLWNGGTNHIIFNLYSGTWPDYAETLGFDSGKAILAKASISKQFFRPGFDISWPLFHRNHPDRGSEGAYTIPNCFPSHKKYLLAFKGKRYVYGIGSETRNTLYHLHNGKDIVLVTTCKHGKSWKQRKDERCEADNSEYDRYDYQTLLLNATFCLVPRGRRLGSFRFLEALQSGCIPVLLSNGWELPFSEVLQWEESVIWGDERLLFQVPEIVRTINSSQILEMRQRIQFLYQTYFSSIENIVFSTLEIMQERIQRHQRRQLLVWNTVPGALASNPQFSDSLRDYPFYFHFLGESPRKNFTAVIYVQNSLSFSWNSPLLRLIQNVGRSSYVSKIIILWAVDRAPPSSSNWPVVNVSLVVLKPQTLTISSRFSSQLNITTDAVFSLDEDTTLNTEELDFAYSVWVNFPDRIVGYPARSHFWDETKSSWGYTSKWTNDYSIVLTGAAIYHRYYHYLYHHFLSPSVHVIVERTQNCEDILLNFLVSHVTKRPPIKLTQRKQYKEIPPVGSTRSPWNDPDHFVQRQGCINSFASAFGYMPLLRSSVRFDPVLFKDPVSNMRKKYRKIEIVGS